mmetsp:Transcript_16841/g.25469  ORF Transcript_16841/g.25469 Transcript_16841/m.25469 type:complete len:176 (+) Transcript_16841:91-618(+)|eukprot:CAMPEP_0178915204 /NCGR_PEP_ID=MMETSP0786-20121207/11888_1 /TAXON_ID=186022 /ORGANISM="Thalassionema frauenfeldii, Strain CCMP 1798" /LENGTH=175 /DNA_ID=CAMNT_0020588271 /DNA_START=58 /DNA_END=585 /DNA_ORIENTATION=-
MSQNEDYDDNYAPSTVLVMLGPMHFEHAGSADVLSVKIPTLEDREKSLKKSAEMIKPNSLETLHIILKSSSVSSLFDETILTTYFDALRPGSETSVHVLGTEEMPVQPGDVDGIRMALVTNGQRLHSEESQEGSWILTAKMPSLDDIDEDDENSDSDDNAGTEVPDEVVEGDDKS